MGSEMCIRDRLYGSFKTHDYIAAGLGLLVLIGLIIVHKQRKNLLNYDL